MDLAKGKAAALLFGGAGAALLGLGLGYKYIWKSEKKIRVGVVSQLFIYPLKSGKGVSVTTAECQKMGLKSGNLLDRHWLVVTKDGHMVTGRQEPRLVLVTLTCGETHVCLNAPDMEELKFPMNQPDNVILDCRVFSADIQGRDCGEEASQWITTYLAAGKTFRLVFFESEMSGRTSTDIVGFLPKFKVAYPDVAPVMLLSEASVKDLSSKLENPVTVERFRPGIVIGDCEAYSEDLWEELQIGTVRLKRVMSCGRCVFTTVDPETGVIAKKEPLETLKSYRMGSPSEQHLYKRAPLFGQLHMVKKTGTLHVGDEVFKITR